MKQNKLIIIMKWTKIILGVMLGIVWIAIIVKIANLPIPFSKQAPYCMGSTMIVFMLLSGVYKGVDYLYQNR